MLHSDLEIDLSGLKCPLPVVKTRKAMDKINSGQVIHVISDDVISCVNFPAFVRELKYDMIENYEEDGLYHYFIKKK